jgi:hypothetical protein
LSHNPNRDALDRLKPASAQKKLFLGEAGAGRLAHKFCAMIADGVKARTPAAASYYRGSWLESA